jgi:hypothetical protein
MKEMLCDKVTTIIMGAANAQIALTQWAQDRVINPDVKRKDTISVEIHC